MSHVAMVQTIIRDLESLKKAVKEAGLEWREGQTSYRWYNNWVQDYSNEDAAYRNGIDPKTYGKNSIHAISVPNNSQAYEIGVCHHPDKEKHPNDYVLVYDNWRGGFGLEQLAGKDCCNIVQKYSQKVVLKQLYSSGYTASQKVNN